MKNRASIQLKELSTIAKSINLKTKKNVSNPNHDETRELEKGYAIARSAMLEYEFSQ